MNPLFLAHLVGDFLVQPTWLVKWKRKNMGGILAHSLIHAAVLWALLVPILPIIIIAGTHGAIDALKIRYEKKHPPFGKGFLADQVLHLGILAAVGFLFPISLTPVSGNISTLLFFSSLFLGGWRIHQASSVKHKKTYWKNPFLWKVVLVFLITAVAGRLCAASSCFEL